MKRVITHFLICIIIGCFGALILHQFRAFFTIDLAGFVKASMGIISAVFVGFLFKKSDDAISKIKDFKLDASAPSIVHEKVRLIKESYLGSDASGQSLFSYFIISIIFYLGLIISTVDAAIQYLTTSFFFFSFLSILYFIYSALTKKISYANKIYLNLQEIDAIEKNRKDLIDELTKAKSSLVKDKDIDLYNRYRKFDINKYVDDLTKKKDNSEGGDN